MDVDLAAGFDLDWILQDPEAAQIEIDRMLVKKGGLAAFIELAWHIIEPEGQYSSNWHIDAICRELEDVLAGRNTRLGIGVPPRHMKSIIVAVMLPAYDWIENPHRRYFFASYNDRLSIQDSVRCRRIIESEWYLRRWGNKFFIVTDQNEKRRFDNDKSGFRLVTSVGGAATGYGADVIVVDDPNNVQAAESEKKREAVLKWFWESLPSRFNNQKKGALIVIQQRVHDADVIGSILERQAAAWRYVCLPAKYDPKSRWKYPGDPRSQDGELLWQARFPEDVLARLFNDLGIYAYSAQYQQAPAPREGGLFKRKWFAVVKLNEVPEDLDYVRGWDFAASLKTTQKSDPDFTATVKIGYSPSRKKWYIVDARRWREEAHMINQHMVAIAKTDTVNTRIAMPQDPGAAGKGDAQAKANMLSAYSLVIEPPTGDKYTRATPLAGQAGVGNVVLVEAGWNAEFLDEMCGFPNASHDDWVDAASSAFKGLTGGNTGMLEYYERLMRKQQEQEKGLRESTVTPSDHGHKLETDMGLALMAANRRPQP